MAAFDIAVFLEHYHQYTCLWDKSLPDFNNRQRRDEAKSALLEVSGLGNVKALRVKIRSIRGTYNNEIRKIKKSTTTGFGADEVYKAPPMHSPLPQDRHPIYNISAELISQWENLPARGRAHRRGG
jgi:hypothetical protein